VIFTYPHLELAHVIPIPSISGDVGAHKSVNGCEGGFNAGKFVFWKEINVRRPGVPKVYLSYIFQYCVQLRLSTEQVQMSVETRGRRFIGRRVKFGKMINQ